jgi:hypothetical protein
MRKPESSASEFQTEALPLDGVDALCLPLGRNEPRAETVMNARANNKETRCFAKSLSVVP